MVQFNIRYITRPVKITWTTTQIQVLFNMELLETVTYWGNGHY